MELAVPVAGTGGTGCYFSVKDSQLTMALT